MKKDYYLCFLLLLSACTRDLDYSPPYEGDKLVVNGCISPTEGVSVKITHSINPVGTYYYRDSLIVKDASVVLFIDNEKVTELKYSGKGFYSLPDHSNIGLYENRKYKLAVNSPSYGQVETEEICIPPKPVYDNFTIEKNGYLNINNDECGLLSFSILSPTASDAYFYIETLTNNQNVYFYPYNQKEGEKYFGNCEKNVNNILVYSNECGYSNQLHKYLIPLEQEYYDTPVNSEEIRMGTISKEFYEYAKSYNDMSGIEYGFAEPALLKSNVKGGYGLVYASNLITFSFP